MEANGRWYCDSAIGLCVSIAPFFSSICNRTRPFTKALLNGRKSGIAADRKAMLILHFVVYSIMGWRMEEEGRWKGEGARKLT